MASAVSVSPTHGALHERINQRQSSTNFNSLKTLHPVESGVLRLLILENISKEAVHAFKVQGFHVDHYTKAMSEEELLEKIGMYHGIGIRSKTRITAKVLQAATKVCGLAFHSG
jgi:D-3-phosphoglycerate dehydrogenase / 2-oxoglutarate reductase